MKKLKKITVVLLICITGCAAVFGLASCSSDHVAPTSDENILYDLVKTMETVRVADGFLATYASVIPGLFVEDEYTLTYETLERDGKTLYIAVVDGTFHPRYNDKSTRQGTIKFLCDLSESNKALSPWPYEDPDGVDDAIWNYVTHKDPSER